MDAIDRFASEASLFVEWLRDSTDRGEAAAREAVIRLMRLYLAAVELPPALIQELESAPDVEDFSDEALRSAEYAICGRFPFDMYGEVFDPLVVPAEEPGIGSLSDDLIDIFRDVVTGLHEYKNERRAQANWEWQFRFQIHWGNHVTSAIRALHHWLANHALDQLRGKP